MTCIRCPRKIDKGSLCPECREELARKKLKELKRVSGWRRVGQED